MGGSEDDFLWKEKEENLSELDTSEESDSETKEEKEDKILITYLHLY